MSTQRLEDGDPFERQHAEWIRKRFPYYEQTWSKYIGNDGSSQPLEIRGMDKAKEDNHAIFRQCHYSLALYTYLFEQHAIRSLARLRGSIDARQHQTLDAYLSYTEDFTLYIALLGQVCDMVQQIGPPLNRRQIGDQAASFMEQRNNAIHTARIPMGWDYRGVKIAKIAGTGSDGGVWAKFVAWDAMGVDDYQYLEVWMQKTRDQLLDTFFHTISPMIWGAARDYFGADTAVHPPFRSTDQKAGYSGHPGGDTTTSGTWKSPPSGARDPG